MLLSNVPWKKYDILLETLDERHLRLTYDQGTLEIMPLSPEHERLKVLARRLIDVLGEELDMDVCGMGSTTCRREDLAQGLEPDECFYVGRVPKTKGKKSLNLRRDPPPDLGLEIDVTHSSLDRLAIYAALGVSEVWRVDREVFHIYSLTRAGAYVEVDRSRSFPLVSTQNLAHFLKIGLVRGDRAMVKDYRKWIRQEMPKNGSRPR